MPIRPSPLIIATLLAALLASGALHPCLAATPGPHELTTKVRSASPAREPTQDASAPAATAPEGDSTRDGTNEEPRTVPVVGPPDANATPKQEAPPPEVQREIARSNAADQRAHQLAREARERPDDLPTQIALLRGYLELGLVDELIDAAPPIIEKFPRSADALVYFSRALLQNGDFDLAKLQLQRALKLEPANTSALETLAQIDFMRGDLKAAEEGLRKALSVEPGRQTARLALITLLEQTGRYKDAMSAISPPGGGTAPPELAGRRSLLPDLAKVGGVLLTAGSKTVSVPFKSARGYPPLVSVKIGESFEKLFVIDTGSEEMVISPETAATLGLPEKGKATIKDEEGREYPTPAYAILDRISIGEALVRRVPVRVAPGLRYPTDQIAGAIGREILRRFRVILDYPSKTLTLGRTDGPPLQGVPFDQANSILLDGRIGERLVGKFVLDTSSYTPGAMDLLFVSREVGLTMFSEGVTQIQGGAYFFKFTMPQLDVGGAVFTKFPATGVDLRQLQHQIGVNVRGVVGQSLLRSCRLEIDFKNQKLLLKKVEPPAEPAKVDAAAPKEPLGAK